MLHNFTMAMSAVAALMLGVTAGLALPLPVQPGESKPISSRPPVAAVVPSPPADDTKTLKTVTLTGFVALEWVEVESPSHRRRPVVFSLTVKPEKEGSLGITRTYTLLTVPEDEFAAKLRDFDTSRKPVKVTGYQVFTVYDEYILIRKLEAVEDK